MNKENIIDLSKLPAVEGKNIVNIIALNGAGEIIKADSDYITTESLAATIEPFVTDEELDDRLTDYYMDGEVDELIAETKEEILGDYSNIEPEYQVKTLAGLTQVILDNELVIATALNQLNDGKADVSEPLFSQWKNDDTVLIGEGAVVSDNVTSSVVIGNNAKSAKSSTVAIGNGAATIYGGIAIGTSAMTNTEDSIIIGNGACGEGIAIGPKAMSSNGGIAITTSGRVNSSGIVIGSSKNGVTLTPGVDQIMIGKDMENCSISGAVAIGKPALVNIIHTTPEGEIRTSSNGNTNINNKIWADFDGNVFIKYDGVDSKRIKLQDWIINPNEVALKSDIPSEWTGTQSQYDALETKDDNTTYYIIED